MAANSLSIWAPTFFTRVHGYSIATLGIVAVLTSLTFGISGPLLGGFLADRLRRSGRGGRMRLGAGVFLCVVMIAAYGIGSPLIGKLNDLFGAATNPGVMRYGFLVSPFSSIFAAVLLWRGSKVLEKIRE